MAITALMQRTLSMVTMALHFGTLAEMAHGFCGHADPQDGPSTALEGHVRSVPTSEVRIRRAVRRQESSSPLGVVLTPDRHLRASAHGLAPIALGEAMSL